MVSDIPENLYVTRDRAFVFRCGDMQDCARDGGYGAAAGTMRGICGKGVLVMRKYIWVPGWWVIKHKLFMGNRYRLEENKFVKQA